MLDKFCLKNMLWGPGQLRMYHFYGYEYVHFRNLTDESLGRRCSGSYQQEDRLLKRKLHKYVLIHWSLKVSFRFIHTTVDVLPSGVSVKREEFWARAEEETGYKLLTAHGTGRCPTVTV